MKYFHGNGKNSCYFEGWYVKLETRQQTIALIPSFHVDGQGARSASLQVITDTRSYSLTFPAASFFASEHAFFVRIGDNFFSEAGMSLNIRTADLSLTGSVTFGPLSPPRRPMMGPFRFLPFLQCSHDVLSMRHRVCGRLVLNGAVCMFENTPGYIESDRGSSFPDGYFWLQTFFASGGIMAAAATIPLPGRIRFTGFLCHIRSGQKEYRIATYRGARVISCAPRRTVIRQGNFLLVMEPAQSEGHALNAPSGGKMNRIITERLSGPARCRLYRRGVCLLDVQSSRASTEFLFARRTASARVFQPPLAH